MKIPAALTFVALITCAPAQIPTSPHPWRATIKVVDESGGPVQGADVEVGYYVQPPLGHTEAAEKIHGLTGTDGVFIASHADKSVSLSFRATKAGYYPSSTGHELGLWIQYDRARWNPTTTLLMKKVGSPISMYAKRVRSPPPAPGTAIGYDLALGDWVAPHGKGGKTDILFATYLDKRAENDWDYRVVVTFPNPGDGIQPFATSELERTSSLRSPHQAPETGYEPQWTKTQAQRPAEPSVYGINKELSFFFRVRTTLDEKGNVKTANYGKIYGDFMDFQYFLNPQPNSRNVEFDTAKNLARALGPSEMVREP